MGEHCARQSRECHQPPPPNRTCASQPRPPQAAPTTHFGEDVLHLALADATWQVADVDGARHGTLCGPHPPSEPRQQPHQQRRRPELWLATDNSFTRCSRSGCLARESHGCSGAAQPPSSSAFQLRSHSFQLLSLALLSRARQHLARTAYAPLKCTTADTPQRTHL